MSTRRRQRPGLPMSDPLQQPASDTAHRVEIVGRRAVARVPATSANLGPGFDAFGLCLGLFDDLAVTTMVSGLTVEVAGEGADTVPTDEEHLVIQSLRATLDVLGASQPGLSLSAQNQIPHGRGLGSSAAAIVAGIRLAQALVPERVLTDVEALRLADRLEGHPDNVAACLLGGLTIAWTDETGAQATRLDVDEHVVAAVLIPEHSVLTQTSRGLLPATVPHRDAAANAGRAGLLVAALTSQPHLLFAATRDWLHQSQRGSSMPSTIELVSRLRERQIAATVSGAGPSVLILSQGAPSRYADLVPAGWEVKTLRIQPAGCVWAAPD